jgi:hypothetical protein
MKSSKLFSPGVARIGAAQDWQRPFLLNAATAELAKQCIRSTLPYGCAGSYGDLCLNTGGRLITTERLNRLIYADWARGILRAESGPIKPDPLSIPVSELMLRGEQIWRSIFCRTSVNGI